MTQAIRTCARVPRRWRRRPLGAVVLVAGCNVRMASYPDSAPPEATRTDASQQAVLRAIGGSALSGKIRVIDRGDGASILVSLTQPAAGRVPDRDPRDAQLLVAERVFGRRSMGAPVVGQNAAGAHPDVQYGNAEQRVETELRISGLHANGRERRRRAQRRAVLRHQHPGNPARCSQRCHRVRCVRADAPASVLTRPLDRHDRPITMGFLADRRILITGVLSTRSIAYGVAKACHREGATLAFTYANDDLQERVAKIAAEFGPCPVLPCDVASDDEIAALFDSLRSGMGRARRLAAFDRIRAARGARRRLSERAVAQRVRRRARHLELQLRRARERRAPADARVAMRRC